MLICSIYQGYKEIKIIQILNSLHSSLDEELKLYNVILLFLIFILTQIEIRVVALCASFLYQTENISIFIFFGEINPLFYACPHWITLVVIHISDMKYGNKQQQQNISFLLLWLSFTIKAKCSNKLCLNQIRDLVFFKLVKKYY